MNPIKGMRVFLSGPMTGIEHFNAPEFARAHAICKEAGAAFVYNPAAAWLRETKDESTAKTHEDYMRACIGELTRGGWGVGTYDCIVLLDGWVESDGASIEYEVACACGIKVFQLCDLVNIYLRDGIESSGQA